MALHTLVHPIRHGARVELPAANFFNRGRGGCLRSNYEVRMTNYEAKAGFTFPDSSRNKPGGGEFLCFSVPGDWESREALRTFA